jgi:hypothetical protein
MQRTKTTPAKPAEKDIFLLALIGKLTVEAFWKECQKILPKLKSDDKKLSPADIIQIERLQIEGIYQQLKVRHEQLKQTKRSTIEERQLDENFLRLGNFICAHISYTSSHTQLNCDFTAPPQVGQKDRAVVTFGAGTLAADTVEITGSTFARVQTGGEKKETKSEKSFVLDGGHREYLTDSAGNVTGFVIARSDGCGHLGGTSDEYGWAKDQLTGEITQLLVTEGTKLIKEASKKYKDPIKAAKHVETQTSQMVEQLQKLAFDFRKMRAKELKIPEGEVENRATLTIGITLKTPTGFQFAGFSIGKTMFLALDTSANTVTQVVPAVKKREGLTQSIPFFSSQIPPKDILTFNTALSANHAILDPSDGVFDALPCEIKEGENRTIVSLQPDALNYRLSSIPQGSTAKEYADVFFDAATLKSQQEYQQSHQSLTQVAEDEKEMQRLQTQMKELDDRFSETKPSVLLSNMRDIVEATKSMNVMKETASSLVERVQTMRQECATAYKDENHSKLIKLLNECERNCRLMHKTWESINTQNTDLLSLKTKNLSRWKSELDRLQKIDRIYLPAYVVLGCIDSLYLISKTNSESDFNQFNQLRAQAIKELQADPSYQADLKTPNTTPCEEWKSVVDVNQAADRIKNSHLLQENKIDYAALQADFKKAKTEKQKHQSEVKAKMGDDASVSFIKFPATQPTPVLAKRQTPRDEYCTYILQNLSRDVKKAYDTKPGMFVFKQGILAAQRLNDWKATLKDQNPGKFFDNVMLTLLAEKTALADCKANHGVTTALESCFNNSYVKAWMQFDREEMVKTRPFFNIGCALLQKLQEIESAALSDPQKRSLNDLGNLAHQLIVTRLDTEGSLNFVKHLKAEFTLSLEEHVLFQWKPDFEKIIKPFTDKVNQLLDAEITRSIMALRNAGS